MQPLNRDAVAGTAQLVGHPGIEKQGIHHRGVVNGPLQILRPANPQGFPNLTAQAGAQLAAELGCFGAVQLHHSMALSQL